MTSATRFELLCPLPLPAAERRICLGHGSGGRLSQELVSEVFLPQLGNEVLSLLEDSARVSVGATEIAVTTDAFVVSPIEFPGGDIGKLAVCGTVNDLAVSGARPLYLTASFVLEEGLPLDVLSRIVASMKAACIAAGVQLVAGDTKVVERGKADQIFITTTGVGLFAGPERWSIRGARPGDRVLVSGSMGDHGVAILSQREGLTFETELQSDCAPLAELCRVLLDRVAVRCLRDPTRGGLATALNEIARASAVGVLLEAAAIPIKPAVRAACELFGFDPLYMANEGKLLAIVPESTAEQALSALRGHPLGRDAALVGTITAEPVGAVRARSASGYCQHLRLLAGDPLPRIC
jgi:hydrogenase expression/formation protein HypE